MATGLKWPFRLLILTLLHLRPARPQTTTLATTTTDFTNTPEVTTPTTTFVPTLTPLITTEGTSFATADTAPPTSTLATEVDTLEPTTEGQATNEALRTSGFSRGFRFDSQRNRPDANLEAAPEQETVTEKPEEKKIAWKFGRGGNNQESWPARPAPNAGFPAWKKEAPATTSGEAGQPTDTAGKNKQNEQAYIVWSVGQGNQANGWTLGGNPAGWAPAGAIPANTGWESSDASAGGNSAQGSWNAGGWSEDQSQESEDGQGGWTADNTAPGEGTGEGWYNGDQSQWNSQAGNSGGWDNEPAPGPPTNGQPPPINGQPQWAPQGNGGGGTWDANPQPQGNNGNGGGWTGPQQGGGWASQPPTGGAQAPNGGWNSNGGNWAGPPATNADNSWNNGAPPATANGGWNDDQQNSGGGNNGAGWQDGAVAWKVYNEDTKTMENIDDNSGWKVVGDGGPDGWKLVDENGNLEWKIENINGEWKVTSADELPKTNDTALPLLNDAANATESTNSTSAEVAATTSSPTGGWDDDKQGRYIIWKFSEDGKGEAKVYGGGGSEPEVWTVGDNNQWWKETMGVKEADAVAQKGWNSGGGSWQGNGNGGWQSTAPQTGNRWQSTAPQTGNGWQSDENGSAQQNGAWQSGNGSPGSGTGWQKPASQTGGGKWKNNAAVQGGGNSWQTGGSAAPRGGKRWQQNGSPATQNKWNNNGAPAQTTNGWQNQAPQSAGWNSGNAGPPATNGWQNRRPTPQPKPTQQSGWQNGPPQTSGGWANGGQVGGGKKGKWRNNGNRPTGRWVSNNANGAKNNAPPSGKVWNRGSGWRTAPDVQAQGNGGWSKNNPSSGTPPTNSRGGGGAYQSGGNKAVQGQQWAGNGGGQAVPYILVIKSPDAAGTGTASNPWANTPNGGTASKKSKNGNGSNNKPQNNRRSNGWKMNRAGSSGWQWNPQGGKEGWQWRDGWMGSGGGFGGWMGDKGTMYSNWRPSKTNGAQSRKSPSQRSAGTKGNKKSASKMVFVFGTKRNSGNTYSQPSNKANKTGKQVIILDYSSGGKKIPKGEEGMKKDIESVIQAIKTAKPTGARRTAWKQTGQDKSQSQQWSR